MTEREFLSCRRMPDDSIGVFLDERLWQKYTVEELRHPGVLWIKLGRAIKELVVRRIETM